MDQRDPLRNLASAFLHQSESTAAKYEPDLKEKLTAQGVELSNATPAQLASLLQEDLARWSKTVKESGATID